MKINPQKIVKLALTFGVYLSLGWLSVGCGTAQVTPKGYNMDLSWVPPSATANWTGCTTTNPCTYVVSRASLPSGTSSCPTPSTTTPNYTPLNLATPATGTTFTDGTATGLTACYIVQTEQGSAVSLPSNTAGAFYVPGALPAPLLSGAGVTSSAKPLAVGPETAPVLAAKLTPVR